MGGLLWRLLAVHSARWLSTFVHGTAVGVLLRVVLRQLYYSIKSLCWQYILLSAAVLLYRT